MAEAGVVSRALLALDGQIRDDRALAGEICRACVAGLDIDGAAISLLTASTLRETLYASRHRARHPIHDPNNINSATPRSTPHLLADSGQMSRPCRAFSATSLRVG